VRGPQLTFDVHVHLDLQYRFRLRRYGRGVTEL
jgi:hypothetical protein